MRLIISAILCFVAISSAAWAEDRADETSYCGSSDLQKLLIPEYACFGMGGAYPYMACAVGTLVGLKPVYFGVACREHDECYSTKGANKSECDDRFFSLLRATCDETLTGTFRKLSRSNCYNTASEYHHQVDLRGCEAFMNAQNRAGISNPSCKSAQIILPSQQVTYFGSFSNMVYTEEHMYGSEVSLWKAGDIFFGYFFKAAGLIGAHPKGVIENVTYDPKTGKFGFQTKLSLGEHSCAIHKGIPSREVFIFEGKIIEGAISGTVKTFNTLHENRLDGSEKIILKKVPSDGLVPPKMTYAEWLIWIKKIGVEVTPELNSPTSNSANNMLPKGGRTDSTSYPSADNATLPSTMPAFHQVVLRKWLRDNPRFRMADVKDCACSADLPSIRKAYANHEPYYAAGDFNRDGRQDFAVVVIDRSVSSTSPPPRNFNSLVVVFNGADSANQMMAFQLHATGIPSSSLLFLSRESGKLAVGQWEGESSPIVATSSGYAYQ